MKPALDPVGHLGHTWSKKYVRYRVESPVSSWTPAIGAGTQTWERATTSLSPINYVCHGPDGAAVTDVSLISPALSVGPGPFSFSFRHRHSFESSGGVNFDGGVIEISTDGGSTWTDIGAAAGYTGTITTGFGTLNPLAGRLAYTGASSGCPNFNTKVVNLGTAYAGQTVKIRFRIGADQTVGAPGWDTDDFVFTGILNTPFHGRLPDPGCP